MLDITLDELLSDNQDMDESIIRYLSKMDKYGTTKHKEIVANIYEKKAFYGFYL